MQHAWGAVVLPDADHLPAARVEDMDISLDVASANRRKAALRDLAQEIGEGAHEDKVISTR